VKFNWNPSSVAFIDFETQSNCPLTSVRKYSQHPSTRALTCVLRMDGQNYRFGPYLNEADCAKLDALTMDHTLVAHNAPFDESVWTNVLHLPERAWFDTVPCCRAGGYPGGLDDVGTVLTGKGKDKNGKRLLEMLCILKPGQKPPSPGPAYRLLLDYNARDVELLEEVFCSVRTFAEPAIMTVDRTINDRGIPVDRPFMESLRDAFTENEKHSRDNFEGVATGVNPGSSKQMVAWLKEQGFDVPGINKFVWKTLLERPEEYFVGDSDMDTAFDVVNEALQHRREVVRVGKGKAASCLEALDDDGRLRDQLVCYGAHTGRWSGRKLQPHNMPQAVPKVDTLSAEPTYADAKRVAEEATEKLGRRVHVSDVLNSMLRHAVRSVALSPCDYGSVEARGTAWVAGEQRMLAIFADPKNSVYLDMARALYNRNVTKADYDQYNFCKALVLGCTYGMSGKKFEWMCKSRNVRTETLREAGFDVCLAVKKFRETYPAIPVLWKRLHQAVHCAVATGRDDFAGKSLFTMVGRDLHIVLPSGRPLRYRNARVEKRVPGYCKLYGMPEELVDTVVFDNHRHGTGFLYGSKVCENVVQGFCRDFLAETLVAMESAGLEPCLHVHDEGVPESDKLEEALRIMSTPPAWAVNFPLLAEGYTGPVWTKQSGRYKELKAMNGKVLC